MSKKGGKVIRCAVHGDIVLGEPFVALIDCPEFQRLRRIRQLSTALLVFPTAEHSRFSHSIGTYHVMQQLLDHFKPILAKVNLELSQREVNLALAAALLHDIGHGPFSHAFEGILPSSRDHEDWTRDIIMSDECNIKPRLVEHFDEDFPADLVDLIAKERLAKHEPTSLPQPSQFDLFTILSPLISSQLDADRIDYLMRDAYFTGVLSGQLDTSRLISALTINVLNNEYLVCIKEKYLSSVEEYLLARYHMYETVYFHPLKCVMEKVVHKIIHRFFTLYMDNRIESKILPIGIISAFENSGMIPLKDYLELDDTILYSMFSYGANHEDPILSRLCFMLLNRVKFKKVLPLYSDEQDLHDFKAALVQVLMKYEIMADELEELPFIVEVINKNKVYKTATENLWIIRKDGTIRDLVSISNVITDKIRSEKMYLFMDAELLTNHVPEDTKNELLEDVTMLIGDYERNTWIETEKKYVFQNHETGTKVIEFLKNMGSYELQEAEEVQQIDLYYDTSIGLLDNMDKTLRTRAAGGKNWITIKAPIESTEIEPTLSERREYERETPERDISAHEQFILRHIPELKDHISELASTLKVENKRKKYDLHEGTIHYEVVLDEVTYVDHEDRVAYELQLEIELKSDYLHRVNLKALSNKLESHFSDLHPTDQSKYKRGVELTRLREHV